MRDERAERLREEHSGRVLAGRLRTEHRWQRPCRAFLLCAGLTAGVTAALSVVQDAIAAAEPALLRVPRHAMHASIAWLVPVHLDLPAGEKERLWREHGPRWRAAIAGELAGLAAFSLRYTEVVATDAAIIALAWPADQVSGLRRTVARQPGLPSAVSAGDLVHTTLFRYREPLADPGALLATLAGIDVAAELRVTELLLVRETVFPSLERDVLQRFPLPEPGSE